ncbi:MAG: prepilin-type N-terminal cleavage/methylation domain-containing protein [Thermodesulfobacteriota bacterium]|nr:prepilin-type N-terminal cleavage/methylation domain-containing protein [Thermodesulfobacteriota bacterium]
MWLAGSRKAKGFTLLELIVVLVLMSLMSSLVLPKLYNSISSRDLKKSAQDIVNTLKFARYKAMVLKKILNLKIDVYRNELRLLSNSEEEIFFKKIPEEIKLRFYSEEEISDYEDSNTIIFFPDGTSTGGKFIIENKMKERLIVTIPDLIGKIKIT